MRAEREVDVSKEAVEAFLYREADLLDEGRYQEWEALLADECTYWVPARPDDYDPDRYVSLIYEDRRSLHGRIDRLVSGLAYTQEPRSQLRRVVSNVQVLGVEDGLVDVSSNFALLEYRAGRWTTWAGRVQHRLRPRGPGFEIVRKKVTLVGCDTDLPMLQFLL